MPISHDQTRLVAIIECCCCDGALRLNVHRVRIRDARDCVPRSVNVRRADVSDRDRSTSCWNAVGQVRHNLNVRSGWEGRHGCTRGDTVRGERPRVAHGNLRVRGDRLCSSDGDVSEVQTEIRGDHLAVAEDLVPCDICRNGHGSRDGNGGSRYCAVYDDR